MIAPIDAYPLHWPPQWPRCHEPMTARFDTTIAMARSGLMDELRLLGATNVIISSNAELLKSGEIASRQRFIEDTGVAVYFTLDGAQRCIPCDRWRTIADNLQAIRKTVQALRGIDRWGTPGLVAAAFQGFAALPAGDTADPWWHVLGVPSSASVAELDAAYKRLAKTTHPDAGGSDDAFARLNAAYNQARRTSR